MNDDNKFSYTYTAPTEKEKCEIDSIRNIYAPKNEFDDKLARLRKLNSAVKNRATIIAVVLGVIGVLVFGTGMSAVLVWDKFVLGIILSIAGIVPIIIANPVYSAVFARYKKKYGEEIVRLSDELLNGKINDKD